MTPNMDAWLHTHGEQVVRYKFIAGPLLDILIDLMKKSKDHTMITVSALEARITALESQGSGVKWSGTWERGKAYPEGRLTTHSGGLWLSMRDTVTPPGGESSGWRLIVKSGSIPRDAR